MPKRGRVKIALGAAAAVVALGGAGVAAWRLSTTDKPARTASQAGAKDKAADPLPYVNYVVVDPKDRGKTGTTVYDHDKAYKGYNLYTRKPESTALLIDMNGEVVHRWSSPEGQADASTLMLANWRGWAFAKMAPNGDLFAIIVERMVLKLDWNSKVIAKIPLPAHHDVNIGADGTIYVCTSAPRLVEVDGTRRLILDDGVGIVSPEGEIRKRISFFDLFAADKDAMELLKESIQRQFERVDRFGIGPILNRTAKQKASATERGHFDKQTLGPPEARAKLTRFFREGLRPTDDVFDAMLLLHAVPGVPSDIFHLNTILELRKHEKGLWKDGDLMASFRELDLIIVFDPNDGKIEWMWGTDDLSGQHEPSVTPKGNVLVFDNGAFRDGEAADISQIVEIDPVTKKRVWSYVGDPPRSFFSIAEGGAQLLPNDNVLAAMETGRAFEVTRAGKIVWEYFNPKLDASKKSRAGFYRMERLPPSIVEPLLASHPKTP